MFDKNNYQQELYKFLASTENYNYQAEEKP